MTDVARHTVAEIARLVGATLHGEGGAVIVGVAPLSAITRGAIVFAEHDHDVAAALASEAAAVVAARAPEGVTRPAVLVTPHVRRTFAEICQRLFTGYPREAVGAHPTAFVHPDAVVEPDAAIGPHAVVSGGCRVGARATLRAGVVLDAGAEVGHDCYLFPGVVIGRDAVVGPRTVVHPNAVIGGEGFGFTEGRGGNTKQPQFGRVVIGADCEIGACATIDRGTLGDTVIGDDVKIDNLVQIAHNCRVGSHVRISALSGLAGGAVVEDECVFGGQSGVGNRVVVRRGTMVGAQAAVLADTEPGVKLWGTPARDLRAALKETAIARRLPELLKRIRALERVTAARRAAPPKKPADVPGVKRRARPGAAVGAAAAKPPRTTKAPRTTKPTRTTKPPRTARVSAAAKRPRSGPRAPAAAPRRPRGHASKTRRRS